MTEQEVLRDLSAEDEETLKARAERAIEMNSLFPIPPGGYAIGGGMETGLAFHEARLAYVSGLWLSTIFVAVAAIERHVGASIYASGGEAAKHMRFSDLMARAKDTCHITEFESSNMDN